MSQNSKFFDAVFFDMDGIVVDSEPEWFQSEIEVTQKFGYTWTEQDQVSCLGGPLSRVGQYMHDKCNSAESPEYFTQALIETQTLKMRGNTPTMPGALELVRELQSNRIATGLVSASPRKIVDAVLDNLGHQLFPFSISSDDVANTKPHPDCYLKAATLTESRIDNCLVFEDSLTGMNAAVASGAYLIAVPHMVTIEESAKVRVVSSLEQLSYQKLQELSEDFSKSI